MTPELSVLVPAYNEERRLPATLARVREFLGRQRIDHEIIVVDDGSTDRTAAVAVQALSHCRSSVVVQDRNCGKGLAFRTGFERAAGRLVLLTDADLSTSIETYPRLRAALHREHAAVAIGSRLVAGARILERQPAQRRITGLAFRRLVRRLYGLPFADTQCGFKLFRRRTVLPIVRTMRVRRFAFDVEMLWLCRRAGLGVAEVPVDWCDAPGSKVRIGVDPMQMLLELALLRLRHLRPSDRHEVPIQHGATRP